MALLASRSERMRTAWKRRIVAVGMRIETTAESHVGRIQPRWGYARSG